jgi:hypothetical protein
LEVSSIFFQLLLKQVALKEEQLLTKDNSKWFKQPMQSFLYDCEVLPNQVVAVSQSR